MVSFKEGSSAGIGCPNCGARLVTTVGDSILEDDTVHGAFIKGGNVPQRAALVSHLVIT